MGGPGRLVRAGDLELLDGDVTRAGGSLQYLEGARYGLAISIFPAEILEGTRTMPHIHDSAEVFVVTDGRGGYLVGADTIEAAAGDVVIVPAGVSHAVVNMGPGSLRHVAIHEAPTLQVRST